MASVLAPSMREGPNFARPVSPEQADQARPLSGANPGGAQDAWTGAGSEDRQDGSGARVALSGNGPRPRSSGGAPRDFATSAPTSRGPDRRGCYERGERRDGQGSAASTSTGRSNKPVGASR